MPGLDIARFMRLHAPVALFVAALAVGARLHAPRAPERSLEGLSRLLGEAAGVVVASEAIGWEPAPFFPVEALWGRPVLFLGAKAPDGRRDLYRARVRVTLGGQPIEVTQIENLTQTPLGDETALEVVGQTAVLATTAFGRIQGITVLDLGGVHDEDLVGGWAERWLAKITAYRETGSWSGLGRVDLVFDEPARFARLKLEPPELRIDFGNPQRDIVYDTDQRAARVATGEGEAFATRVVAHQHGGKALAPWLADALSSVIGSGRIARLEQTVLELRSVFGSSGAPPAGDAAETKSDPAAERERAAVEVGQWPPPPVPSPWAEPRPGEGEWKPVRLSWLARPKGTTAEPPPYFYTTFIRADKERPDSLVQLVAMDMRQLELGIEAGYDEPHALTGPPGTGRLPAEPDIAERVVATFNGAPEAERGGAGMMVRRRVLVPPMRGAATVVVTREADVGLGSFPDDADALHDIVSYRQHIDTLVGDGEPPAHRVWGFRLVSPDVAAERSALCLTRSRQIIYAWASRTTGARLGAALERAGCDYALPLDRGPEPCGFAFVDAGAADPGEARTELLNEAMSLDPARHVLGSPRDFFYVLVRDTSRLRTGKLEFAPSGARQPPPGWLPALYQAERKLGALPVTVYAFEKGRFDWVVRAGDNEPAAVDKRPKKTALDDGDDARVLASVNLGHTTDATRYGLAFEGAASLALRRSYATLVLEEGRSPRIVAAGRRPDLRQTEDAVQLPMLANEGELLPAARDHGAMRLRAALCVAPRGSVLIARAHHDSDHPVVRTLIDAGCTRVVGLDRGSKHPAFVHLSETETPPQEQYETTVLYALGRPMIPGAFRWQGK